MYSIVCFPQNLPSEIAKFRSKFDPKSDLIQPHITLVFPFAYENEDHIQTHIIDTLKLCEPFDVEVSTYNKSLDDYLYLIFSSGNNEICSLHDRLYQNRLSQFFKPEIPYEPHLTIGYFRSSQGIFMEKAYEQAMDDIQIIPKRFSIEFDSISLVRINDLRKPRDIVQTFNF